MIKQDRIGNEDWRLDLAAFSNKDVELDKNTVEKTIAKISFGEKVLHFSVPNISAILLDVSCKFWIRSQRELAASYTFVEWEGLFSFDNTIYPKEESDLFDLLQERIESIIFAYTALEAFANESLPDNAVFTNERENKRCTETYNKDQIERFISLDEKISTIIPQYFGVESPKGKKIWQRYLALKKLRDRLIHLKSNDRKSISPSDDTIWKELLDKDKPNFAIEVKDIIGYLIQNVKEKPRWFTKFPY